MTLHEKSFEAMSKGELEDHGRSVGIELDRRETKLKLVAQLRDFITLKRIQEQMDIEAEDVAYELEAAEHPLHPEFEECLDDPVMVNPQDAKDFARMSHRMEEEARMAENRLEAANTALADAKQHAEEAEKEAKALRSAYNQHVEAQP